MQTAANANFLQTLTYGIAVQSKINFQCDIQTSV